MNPRRGDSAAPSRARCAGIVEGRLLEEASAEKSQRHPQESEVRCITLPKRQVVVRSGSPGEKDQGKECVTCYVAPCQSEY